MADALKHLINSDRVDELARALRRASPTFDAKRFTALATDGLHKLELKQRSVQLCVALEATLPTEFSEASTVLVRAMPELSGWLLWPVGEFVARRGLGEPERALEVLHALTQRFTAEFAIRPFLIEHPALTYAKLAGWVKDQSEHVRRLVSEGSRPLLPWGQRLHHAVNDPSPALPLLRALQDDESEYVRRSVANHLNDIAKHHPALLVEWLETHLPNATKTRRSLLRHASRTLIKQGHPGVLSAFGIGTALKGTSSLQLTPKRIALGETVTLNVKLESTSRKPQLLAIDYVVHHVKSDGSTSPKVFKGWSLTLAPNATLELMKHHTVRPITTRRYYPGRHRVVVQVNGVAVAEAVFSLSMS